MDDTDVEEFDRFVEENWGKVNIKSNRIIEDGFEDAAPAKRGRKPKQA